MADEDSRYEDSLPKLNGVPIDTGSRYRRTGTGKLITLPWGSGRLGGGDALREDAAEQASRWRLPQDPARRQEAARGFDTPASHGSPTPASTTGRNLAIAALVFGILSILFSGVVFAPLIFGMIAIALAANSVRRFGKSRYAATGRICGIAGIVLAVVVMALGSFSAISALVDDAIGGDSEYTFAGGLFDGAEDDSDYAYVYDDAQERQAAEAFEALFEGIVDPSEETLASYAPVFDRLFAAELGISSMSDLGVDPQEFALWMMEGLSYEPDGVYLYTDGTGSAYAECQVRDYYEFLNLLFEGLYAYEESPEGQGLASEGEIPNEVAGSLMREAMGSTPMNEVYVFFELQETDGVWAVKDGSPENVVSEVFRVW